MSTPPITLDYSALRTAEIRDLARKARALERRLLLAGPKTDDELHAWVKQNLKVDIPRVSVCPEHVAPFQFLADMYFERTQAVVVMANRGGAKTFLAAIWHVLNGKFRPGVEMASVGAIESQARRAYQHVLKLLCIEGGVANVNDHAELKDSIQLQTVWRNGSILEILGGTKNAVNGPHPQKVHFDEVELADPEVYDESRNMSTSKEGIGAQDLITSTRKGVYGLMQKLIDEINEAELAGLEPPYQLYSWCVFEAAAPVANCQAANPDLPEGERCNCNGIVKGTWEDGTPRRFSDVCKGRLARSQGWIPLRDLHKTFRLDSKSIWEAQQECIRPSTAGLVVPQFDRQVHGIKSFDADPHNGPIFMGVDFGGRNPHAVNWYQLLRYELTVETLFGQERRLKEGSLVCFDEIYITEIGNAKLAEMIIERELRWRRKHRSFRIAGRFADPQGYAARLDLKRAGDQRGHDLKTQFHTTRDVKEHIKRVVELFEEQLFAVDTVRCPMFCDEIESWHYPAKRGDRTDDPDKPVEDFDHCMANFRYATANIAVLEGFKQTGALPRSGGRRHGTAQLVRDSLPSSAGPGRYLTSQHGRSYRDIARP